MALQDIQFNSGLLFRALFV